MQYRSPGLTWDPIKQLKRACGDDFTCNLCHPERVSYPKIELFEIVKIGMVALRLPGESIFVVACLHRGSSDKAVFCGRHPNHKAHEFSILGSMPVRYFVRDVSVAAAFYVDQIGFELVEQWGPAFAILSHNDTALWLSGPDTSAAKPMPDGRVPEPGGWNRVVVTVENLEGLVAGLRLTGTKFRNDPISGPGGSQVLIEDPDGNPIELFQPR